MPISKGLSKDIINQILAQGGLDDIVDRLKPRLPDEVPLPHNLARERLLSPEAQSHRLDIICNKGQSFEYITGQKQITDAQIFEGNIENFIGLSQMPIGVIGPLRINGRYAHGDYYIPLATTEGALVASYNRGAKLISMSGGATTLCLTERVSRAPGFVFSNIMEAGQFSIWCVQHYEALKKAAESKSRYGKLEEIKVTFDANHIYLICEYTTGDAAGQNMVTVMTDALCKHIIENCPIKPRHWFIESNMSGDKKATAMSYLFVRGKKVTTEVCIPRKLFKRVLRTDPEKMMEYWKMAFVGGVQSGSIGVQGHYANGLAALFIACGQDAACIAEAAVGVTRVDLTDNGDLYISATLPNLIVGTVGGGTQLPTQRECLELVGCIGEGTAPKFAEICAVTALAGEISIMGALAAGHFSQAHERYGRKKKD